MALLDIAGWSKQDFATRWKTLLPCLISTIDEDKETVADMLKIIYISVVPVVPISDLEEAVFSTVCERTNNYLLTILDSLTQILEARCDAEKFVDEKKSREMKTLLQNLTGIIAVVATSVEYLSSLENGIFLENIRSLPSCVIKLIARSFAHCKDSSQLYGRMFSNVSDNLSGLFKAARQLQSSFNTLLEGLKVNDPTDQEIEELCEIIQKLCMICEIVSELDVKIMVGLWKTISRLSCQYRDFLVNQLNIEGLLTQLCHYMSSSCDSFLQADGVLLAGDCDSVGKTIKIVGFHMRILITLIKEYHDHLEEVNILPIYRLIIQFKSYLTPSLASQKFTAEIRDDLVRHIGIGVEPLIAALIDHQGFLAVILEHDPGDSLKDSGGSGMARMMTLLTIVQLLPIQQDEIQDLWLAPINNLEGKTKRSLIDAVFASISECHVELSVPVFLQNAVKNGNPQEQMSFYEYLVTRLCTFVVTFPAEHFAILENCLLENVLRRRQYSAMVAIDVWCFLARCGSAELCRDHCFFLAFLFNKSQFVSSAECCHLVLLIRRLFRLMAPEHQTDFVSKFIGSEVIGILPLDVATISNCQAIFDDIVKVFVNSVECWSSSTAKTVADANTLMLRLSALVNVCRSSVVVEDAFSAAQQSRLASHCMTLMSVLPPADGTDSHRSLFRGIVSSVLLLFSHLTSVLKNRSLAALLLFCDRLLSSSCDDIVRLSILEILGALAAKTFEPDSEQCQVFRVIPRLFSTLLDDDDIIVSQMALETFKSFAKKTSHEALIHGSLAVNDEIRQKFLNYMQRPPNGSQKTQVRLEFLRLQSSAVDDWCLKSDEEILAPKRCLKNDANASKSIADGRNKPPVPKRLRIDEDAENIAEEEGNQSLRSALDQIDAGISAVEGITRCHALPEWGIRRLEETKRRLDTLL